MQKKTILTFMNYLAIFVWLCIFLRTDSFYSVYLIIGLIASISPIQNKNINSRSKLNILFSCIFSFLVTLSNYSIFANINYSESGNSFYSISLFLISLACGFIVFSNTLLFLQKISIKTTKEADSPKKIFLICFLIFACINLFLFFSCYFPGNLTTDSIDEISQILSNSYSNHHPFYYTILIKPFVSIGLDLFNDINIGIALYNVFQIITISAIFSYSMSTLYRIGISKKKIIILSLILAILPYNLMYSFTIWKDILFAFSFLLFIVSLYRYFKKIQPYKKSKLIQILLIFVSGLSVCLFRSNALIAIFISTIIFFVMFKKQYLKLGILLIIIVSSAFILKRPILKAFNVHQPDIIESLSIPSQQIAKTLKYNKDQISEEDLSLINNIGDVDALAAAYMPSIHDPIKKVVRTKNNQEYLKEHAIDFVSLYIRLGLQYPVQYLTSWIDITKGYWNSGYDYWIWANWVQPNNLGIKAEENPSPIRTFVDSYLESFRTIPFLQPLVSIGLAVWILFLLLYRNIITKNKIILFLTIPLLATWLTLLIATPVFSEFRYAYFIFTCLPFLTGITTINKATSKNKEKTWKKVK